MSQVWFPRAVRATDPTGSPCLAVCSSPTPMSLTLSASGTLALLLGQASYLMRPSPGAQGGVRSDRWVNRREGA